MSPSRFGHALAFSPDEKALAVGCGDGSLWVIDPQTGSKNLTVKAHPEMVTALAWSPSAAILANGSGYSGGPLRLWDAISGKPLGTLEGHTSWTSQLLFSADGRRLYSASGDQTIRIWDVQQQKCLAVLHGCNDEIWGLALSPDGTTLASGSKDGVVAFWNALSPQKDRLDPAATNNGFAPAFAPDSRVVAIATGGMKYAFAHTSTTGHRLKPVASGGLNYGLAPAFAPDSRAIAVASGDLVRLYGVPTFSEIESIPPLGAHAIVAAYSPDGQVLASGSTDGWVRFWSCADRCLLKELPGPKTGVSTLLFSTDGTRILSSGIEGGEVRLICWDCRTWQRISSFAVAQVDHAYPRIAAISPDGRVVINGNDEGKVSWWDTASGRLLAATISHKLVVSGVAFSPDGKHAASISEDGTVALWDAFRFKPLATFKGHMQAITGLAFSPDGRRLATGGLSFRDAIKLWDLRTHRELLTLNGRGFSF
jgi:WD40 repeat protein